uniref:Acetyl-CoA carboxylase beta subunit n=2 Tax=Cunninghamia lanceolata TaxID=28977 RepID=A0A7R7DZJ6_CUNLA|nr:acetyl-CoA carboxylase beta subunit [Cunninghamia lanceolata]AGL11014.1 acetyl-CoA carboxylase beta subunit [Cunninghamia lanceolata]BCK52205.1 acetyl-CoA carboxylase beta subunit [Cunninghamia lanceolata var. konishii]
MFEENKDSENIETKENKDFENIETKENKDSENIETKTVEDRFNPERFKHLWLLCENCFFLHYKKSLLEQKGVCSECGATLPITSSERIDLLIDNDTWCPMDVNFSTIDLLDKKHTTFDITMVRKVSILMYKVLYHKYFDFEFFQDSDAETLKTLVAYSNTLVTILRVVLENKIIKYLNLDSKETIKILQDIIGTGLKTVQFILLAIRNRMQDEIKRFSIFKKALQEQQMSLLLPPYLEDRDGKNYGSKMKIMDLEVQKIALNIEEALALNILYNLNKQLVNLKNQLLSQDKFLKVVAVNLVKMELCFPEEKRQIKKIKRRFPFYPGYDPEADYFLWRRKHMAICLMQKHLVSKEFKYWFQNHCGFLEGSGYRFGSDSIVEYVKKQDRYQCDNIKDHDMDDDTLYSQNSMELFHEIEDLYLHHKNNEKECQNNEKECQNNEKECQNNEKDCQNKILSYTEHTQRIYFYLLEIMKELSTLALDSKDKFSKKKEISLEDTEDIEDPEDSEEKFPLTYNDLTEEEKAYVDATKERIRQMLNLGKQEYTDIDEQSYKDYNTSYQKDTGLADAIQTGIGDINGFTVALGVMDFQFMGGSMGSVVGEKITRLIQCATDNALPVILVCASGGARMQEGSFSLMQMNKIAAALHTHQKEKHLLYISVLTSPTTGGVTASFGMLANVTIVEPNAYIAFAGKRVIEQTLNQIVDEEDQTSDSLFDFGMFDSMVPRALLKKVLSETIEMYMY